MIINDTIPISSDIRHGIQKWLIQVLPYQVKGICTLDLIIESILRIGACVVAHETSMRCQICGKNIPASFFVRQDDLQILLPRYIYIRNYSINLY
jgi:hypothetical protein